MDKETIEDVFGLRVRAQRESRGWSQAGLAQRLKPYGVNVHPSAIAKIEARDVEHPRSIRLGEAAALATVLQIDLNSLVDEASGPGTAELEAALDQVERSKEELVEGLDNLWTLLIARMDLNQGQADRLAGDYTERLAMIDKDAAKRLQRYLSGEAET